MSLKEKTFKVGDKVTHIDYGRGIIVEDISNEYAEVYKVNITEAFNPHTRCSTGVTTCSEGLLQFQKDKNGRGER